MEPLYRETAFPAPSFMYLSESLVKEPFLQVPSLTSQAEGRPVSRAFFYLSLKVPSEGDPFNSPVGASMERGAHFQSLLSLIAQSIR